MPARWAERRDASTHMLIGSGPAARRASTPRSAPITDSAATIAATCSAVGLPPTTSARITPIPLERRVAVLARGELLALRAQHGERARQHLARVARVDDVVDVAALGGLVRVEEAVF